MELGGALGRFRFVRTDRRLRLLFVVVVVLAVVRSARAPSEAQQHVAIPTPMPTPPRPAVSGMVAPSLEAPRPFEGEGREVVPADDARIVLRVIGNPPDDVAKRLGAMLSQLGGTDLVVGAPAVVAPYRDHIDPSDPDAGFIAARDGRNPTSFFATSDPGGTFFVPPPPARSVLVVATFAKPTSERLSAIADAVAHRFTNDAVVLLGARFAVRACDAPKRAALVAAVRNARVAATASGEVAHDARLVSIADSGLFVVPPCSAQIREEPALFDRADARGMPAPNVTFLDRVTAVYEGEPARRAASGPLPGLTVIGRAEGQAIPTTAQVELYFTTTDRQIDRAAVRAVLVGAGMEEVVVPAKAPARDVFFARGRLAMPTSSSVKTFVTTVASKLADPATARRLTNFRIFYASSECANVTTRLRAEAFADARRRAQTLAAAAGVVLAGYALAPAGRDGLPTVLCAADLGHAVADGSYGPDGVVPEPRIDATASITLRYPIVQ